LRITSKESNQSCVPPFRPPGLPALSKCEILMRKRESILKTAARLFSTQGFDASTTLQLAREAGVTEPLIYYHFRGKDDLFTRLMENIFAQYFSRIDALEQRTDSAFEHIRRLIELQFDVIDEMPDEVHLIAGACPAHLNDPDGICARGIREFQKRHKAYLTRYLANGIEAGDFVPLPVAETAELLVASINGIIRYHVLNPGRSKAMRQTAVEFCRRSLMKYSKADTKSAV
jgi:AcrR family transcriptional regulator